MTLREIRKARLLIETRRAELARTVSRYGLNHPTTIRASQKVDTALNRFHDAMRGLRYV